MVKVAEEVTDEATRDYVVALVWLCAWSRVAGGVVFVGAVAAALLAQDAPSWMRVTTLFAGMLLGAGIMTQSPASLLGKKK